MLQLSTTKRWSYNQHINACISSALLSSKKTYLALAELYSASNTQMDTFEGWSQYKSFYLCISAKITSKYSNIMIILPSHLKKIFRSTAKCTTICVQNTTGQSPTPVCFVDGKAISRSLP